MEHLFSLEIFAEVGVALAGFSGVAAAIAGSSPTGLLPRQRIGFWMVLFCGLSAMIWALLPQALWNFSISEPLVWRSLCFAEAPFVAIAVVAPWRYHKALERTGHPSQYPHLYWVLGPVVTTIGVGA